MQPLKYRLIASLVLPALVLAPSLALGQADNIAFVAKLDRKYGSRLIYKGDPNGRSLVANFNIDCQSPDGRYLPLKNLLLVRLANEDPRAQLRIEVQVLGGDIRVVDIGRLPNGSDLRTNALQVSKFGDVRPLTFTVEAIYNACYGSHGPIWMDRPR